MNKRSVFPQHIEKDRSSFAQDTKRSKMKFVIILCLFVVHVAAETEEIAGGSPGTGVLTDREGTT